MDAVKQVLAAFPAASAQVAGLAVMGDVNGKAEVIRRVRAAAAQKAKAGDACRQ